jgi:small-conductance mechanosensitive channel
MSEIVVTVPADAPEETLERLRLAFPDARVEAPVPEDATEAGVVEVEEALAEAVAAAPALPARLAEAWAGLGGGAFVLWIALALVAGYAVERAGRALFGRDRWIPADAAASFRGRLRRAVPWILGRVAGLAVFATVAVFVGRALPMADDEARAVARAILGAVLFARGLALFFEALAAPLAPERRLMGFDDAEAVRAARVGRVVVAVVFVCGIARAALDPAGPGEATALARLGLTVVVGAASIWFFLALRRPLAALIGRTTGGASGWRAWLARNAGPLFASLVGLDVGLKTLGVLGVLGPAAMEGSGKTVLLVVAAALTVSGIAALSSELAEEERTPLRLGLLALAEGLIAVAAVVGVLFAWGIDPFRSPRVGGVAALLPGLVEAAAVVIVGLALWRAVTAALAGEAESEADLDRLGEMGGEGDRIATVTPVLRGFLLAVIAVTTVLTALTALGVNVAPLLASAGVLGIAIGFGAQTLVTDVISGLFFLYEDAFRVGEYIETDCGKGSVEKISLRSATLRHHRGAVITLPFSKMGTIQNHSRDWVVMKFSFSVSRDTDVEMVRKLVKKVGLQMAEDPALEGKLLAPLKSQGAVGITGRNFDIGCKFMARPGEQWAIRRKAFAMLQEALNAKGVELAAPELNMAGLASR